MVFLYLGAMIILPLEIATILKFVLIVIFTFAATMLNYEFVVRRIRVLRIVFGLKVYSKA